MIGSNQPKEMERLNMKNPMELTMEEYLDLGQNYYVADASPLVIGPKSRQHNNMTGVISFVTQTGKSTDIFMENAGLFSLERACQIINEGVMGSLHLMLVPARYIQKEFPNPNTEEFYQFATIKLADSAFFLWDKRFQELKEEGLFVVEKEIGDTKDIEMLYETPKVLDAIKTYLGDEVDYYKVMSECTKQGEVSLDPTDSILKQITLKCLVLPYVLPSNPIQGCTPPEQEDGDES